MRPDRNELIASAFDLTNVEKFKKFGEYLYLMVRQLKTDGAGMEMPSFVFQCKRGSIDTVERIVTCHYQALYPGLLGNPPKSPVSHLAPDTAVVHMVFPVGCKLILIEKS